MSVVDNRSQLLALAARCRDRFQLPLPHTPGAFAYGAMVDPKDFGIDGPGAGTGGRGLALQHAFESCMGETAEYLSFLRHQDDPLVQAGDADGSEWLDAVISTPGPGVVTALPLNDLQQLDQRSDKAMRLPADLVLRRQSAEHQADSTGVGAGATRQQAIMSGFLEVVERDAIALWWRGGCVGSRVDIPEVVNLAARIRDEKRHVWCLDITSDTGIPTVVCFSSAEDGTDIVAGASAALTLAHAGVSAFLEMCQMEMSQTLAILRGKNSESDVLSEIDQTWIARQTQLSTVKVPRLLGDPGVKLGREAPKDWDEALHRIHACGLRPTWVDLTRTSLDIPVVRVVLIGAQPPNPGVATPRLIDAQARNSSRVSLGAVPISPV